MPAIAIVTFVLLAKTRNKRNRARTRTENTRKTILRKTTLTKTNLNKKRQKRATADQSSGSLGNRDFHELNLGHNRHGCSSAASVARSSTNLVRSLLFVIGLNGLANSGSRFPD